MSTETSADTSPVPTSKFQDCLLTALGELEQSGDHDHRIPHGLAIKRKVEESEYGPDQIHHGRLYGNLKPLVEQGYVKKSDLDGRTTGYELTAAGRQHLAQTGERLLAASPEVADFDIHSPTTGQGADR